jgi:hypothetical protein
MRAADAASQAHAGWPVRAGSDRLGKFDTRGGERTFAAPGKSRAELQGSEPSMHLRRHTRSLSRAVQTVATGMLFK